MKPTNYTTEQENQIRDLSPITYNIAVELAESFGKKLRSVIAKACSMDGVEYLPKERVAKNGLEITRKSEIVTDISRALGKEMNGLEKATKTSLSLLWESIDSILHQLVERERDLFELREGWNDIR